jgi:hypothetical protein
MVGVGVIVVTGIVATGVVVTGVVVAGALLTGVVVAGVEQPANSIIVRSKSNIIFFILTPDKFYYLILRFPNFKLSLSIKSKPDR